MTHVLRQLSRAFDEISLLTPTEVVDLQRQIEAGLLARSARLGHGPTVEATDAELCWLERTGESARQRFIHSNLPLVAMVARQFGGRGASSAADLFQEGCVGLIIAVERFDHTLGHRFSTYALLWIRAYVGAATARQLGDLNLPTSRAEILRSAQSREAELTQRLGRRPTVAELAATLGRDVRWTAGLMAHERPRSIDEVDAARIDDAAAARDFDAVLDDGAGLAGLFDHLDRSSRQVLELRLGFSTGRPESLAETARRLTLSVGRVRRLEESALEVLRGVCPQSALALL